MNYIKEYHAYCEKYPNRICNAIKQRIDIDNKMLEKYDYQEKFVDNCIKWIETYITLVDGEKVGQNFKMTLPQKYIFAIIFGIWGNVKDTEIDENGNIVGETENYVRITKSAFIVVASGFGKTTFIAAICALILCVDKIMRDAKIFIGSNAQQQSKLCFTTTEKMLKKTKFTKNYRYQDSSNRIINKINNSMLTAMSSKGDNHEGIIPSLIVIDEGHAMKTNKYANDLKKSIKRLDMLSIDITTQGTVRGGYLDTQLEVGRKILNGNEEDFRNQFFIYEQDSMEEIFLAYKNKDIDILFKSNPNLGVSGTPNSLFEKINDMLVDDSKVSSIMTKNFNIPQNPETSYYPAQACIANEYDEEYLKNKAVFIGLDMAYTRSPNTDLAALTFLCVDPVKNTYTFKDYLFLPKHYITDNQEIHDMIKDKTEEDEVDYQYFIDRGDVISVDDYMISEDYIINFIFDKISKYNFNVLKFGLDPNKAEKIKMTFNAKTNDNKFCLEYRAERKVWTTPVIENSKEIRMQGLVYDNNKLTEMHFANTLAKFDSNKYITLINNARQRKDMVIAHMAALSAFSVWSNVQNTTLGISNFVNLQNSFKNDTGIEQFKK